MPNPGAALGSQSTYCARQNECGVTRQNAPSWKTDLQPVGNIPSKKIHRISCVLNHKTKVKGQLRTVSEHTKDGFDVSRTLHASTTITLQRG